MANKENKKKNILVLFSCLKASHITGSVISCYLTIILLNFGFHEENISWIVASIGLTYPFLSMLGGSISDRVGRFKVFVCSKVISCFFICTAFFFTHSRILVVCLYLSEAIENGLDPLINATATDQSKDDTRRKIFTYLSLGNNIGMMIISLVSGFLMDLNMQIYLLVLLVSDLSSICFMSKICLEHEHVVRRIFNDKDPLHFLRKDVQNTHDLSAKNSKRKISVKAFLRDVLGNTYLFALSVVLSIFSILHSQLKYGFPIKLNNMYGVEVQDKFGILLALYYFITVCFNLFYCKKESKRGCVQNLVIGGGLYTIGMVVMAIADNAFLIGVALVIWAIAQMMIVVNNSAYVAENCQAHNVGVLTVFYSNFSSSGVVFGPIITRFIMHYLGLEENWWIMAAMGLLGTGALFFMDKSKQNR